jgi:hypothetical protein
LAETPDVFGGFDLFLLQEQESLINELRNVRFFGVFEYNALNGHWGCFLCNHPEKALGFLQEDQPVIEGQLKEKKGKWRLFRRWRTRYFTLSGGHLSYRGSVSFLFVFFRPYSFPYNQIPF